MSIIFKFILFFSDQPPSKEIEIKTLPTSSSTLTLVAAEIDENNSETKQNDTLKVNNTTGSKITNKNNESKKREDLTSLSSSDDSGIIF